MTINTVLKKSMDAFGNIDGDVINQAAEILCADGLVAFPTETVYGLGANGLSSDAVKKIYLAKGRPSDNPLILHVSGMKMLEDIVEDIPKNAERLIKAFWPGPLTLIFRKKNSVPDEVTCKLKTVAVRSPQNKTALRLIEKVGFPLAAPSANISGKPSPTSAEHVKTDLFGKIDMIIDGGSCNYGIESTIIDVSGENPAILRPGSVTVTMLEDVLGVKIIDKRHGRNSEAPSAPGMKYKHYTPRAEITVVSGKNEDVAGYINHMCRKLEKNGERIGVLSSEETKNLYETKLVVVVGSRIKPEFIARNLYSIFREFDSNGISVVYSEAFYETELGLSIMDRLEKAASFRVIEV